MSYERWCPQIHGVCKEGFPVESTVLCSMWDTVYERCIFVEAMMITADTRRFIQQQMEDKRKPIEELKGKD